MKIETIIITFSNKGEDEDFEHAHSVRFYNGQWNADGPIQSRYMGMCYEIWRIIRETIKKEGTE